MPEIDSRNHFYLGAEHDLAAGETALDRPLLYKSKDLTTHAICVGMTGSGKTGLCLSLIEEALLDGVPVIAIDPKGDLGNLLLGFPDFQPSDYRPWVDESAAERKGMTPDEMAEKTASLWKNGLGEWGQDGDRIRRLNDACERLIFTPGSSAGIPLTVLKSFDAPPKELRDDGEALGERISSAVSGLLALLGIDADPVQSEEHIFLSNIFKHHWLRGGDLGIAELIQEILEPPFDKVGVLGVEQFFPEKRRTKLAMELNNLLASPTFSGWMKGQPLNVKELLHAPSAEQGGTGKPRLSIISIAHLDDSQRMFFVTILLNEVLAWMRTQPGTSSLRALLYMDEVYGYFPPTANPPSKTPMLTLLKQARAFGLGVTLATQNPVDLDYKGLSNCGTWFLGRLQTERDKARVIEGLEGASAQAGSAFDKQAMEATLAALGSRVFLMNNVHEDAPRVFHTRWAMSYLCGPLARDQIETLMDPVRDKFAPPELPPKDVKEELVEPEAEAAGAGEPGQPATQEPAPTAGVDQAEIEAEYEPKIKKAGEREKKAQAYYREQFWQVPGKLFALLFRGAALVMALVSGGATKRKSSSAMAAFERTTAELSQATTARGKWRAARAQRERLEAERAALLAGRSVDSLPPAPVTAKASAPNPLIWVVIALLVLIVLILLVVAAVWFFSRGG